MSTKTDTKGSKSDNVFEAVTKALIQALEDGTADPEAWAKPWRAIAQNDYNPATTAQYKGGNALWFSLVRMISNYEHPCWSTYGDADKGTGWAGLGRQVRRGEKATYGVHWSVVDSKKHFDKNGKPKKVLIPNVFNVFNFAQTDPIEGAENVWEPAAAGPVNADGRIEDVDLFIEATGATINYVPSSERAFYAPSLDSITLPQFEDFTDAASFYATSLHELGHWTGHKSRLDRDLTGRFGSEAYAAEELVAELTSTFACGILGVSPTGPRPDHAHYIAHWIKVLKQDSKALWSIAGKAQRAVDFLAGKVPAEGENDAEVAA